MNGDLNFTGSFSFSVNMSTGAITGATMQGASTTATANGLGYNLTGGSGTMSAGNFNIDNYGGNVLYPYNSPQTQMPQPAGDSNTYMTGSGNINSVGGGVSGTYEVSGSAGTGWNVDKGTFSGSRTN